MILLESFVAYLCKQLDLEPGTVKSTHSNIQYTTTNRTLEKDTVLIGTRDYDASIEIANKYIDFARLEIAIVEWQRDNSSQPVLSEVFEKEELEILQIDIHFSNCPIVVKKHTGSQPADVHIKEVPYVLVVGQEAIDLMPRQTITLPKDTMTRH